MELVCRKFFPGYQDESDISNRTRRIFYEGDTFEGLAWFLLQAVGYKRLSAQDTVEWHGVLGHTDGRLLDDNGVEWLVEFKTMNDKKYKKVAAEGMYIPEYRTQMATYMDATGLPGAWICYNKNSSELMVLIPKPEELADSLVRAKHLVDSFNKIETFADAFNYFRTPPVEPRYRNGKLIGWQVPDSMYWSKYKELLYYCKEMRYFTGVEEPRYRIPHEVPTKVRTTWLNKDSERYAGKH
jgi:hypothetical protein